MTATNPCAQEVASRVVTMTDVPIAGLVALDDIPTLLGSPTTLSATLSAGSNVSFTWAFGDDSLPLGPLSPTPALLR